MIFYIENGILCILIRIASIKIVRFLEDGLEPPMTRLIKDFSIDIPLC